MKLDREDMMEAVANGIRQAILDLGTDNGRVDLPHELLYDAIRQGARDAIWNIANNATNMPCWNFYDAIKEGVRIAYARLGNG